MDAKEPKCPICESESKITNNGEKRFQFGVKCTVCGLRVDGYGCPKDAAEDWKLPAERLATLAAEVAELRKELEAAKGRAYVVYTDDGPIGPCGQSMATTCRWTRLHIFRDDEHMREWAAIHCGMSGRKRIRWEPLTIEYGNAIIDHTADTLAAPAATDRRCGSCGGSGLAIMFGGPHGTCRSCCGTGAAPAATEPADKTCRTCEPQFVNMIPNTCSCGGTVDGQGFCIACGADMTGKQVRP
jgi:hypothetical protein